MTDQKSSKIILDIANFGNDWLIIEKITTSQFNSLEIDSEIDYILIKRLKFDSKLDNILPFIKKIYIQSVKFDNEYYNEQIFIKDDFKVFKNSKENSFVCKTYNLFEKRYQPFFLKFIKCPFNVQIKHYQECGTYEHMGRRDFFNRKMSNQKEDTVTILRRLLDNEKTFTEDEIMSALQKQRCKIADNFHYIQYNSNRQIN